MTGVYFNTAAVIDADGRYLGKYRKHHIPIAIRVLGKVLFHSRKCRLPRLPDALRPRRRLHLYDRHFPEGARILGLNGAEIVYNPSATVAGLSEYLWELEQPAHAVANAYFVAAINRVGTEAPWKIGEFYGKSYFCDPRGKSSASQPRQGRIARRRAESRRDSESSRHLAVLSRPPPGILRKSRGPAPAKAPRRPTKLLRAETIESSSLYNKDLAPVPASAAPGAPTTTPLCGFP